MANGGRCDWPCIWVGSWLSYTRYVPYVGMITIIMTDNPILKYALLAVLAGLVLISRE